MIFLLAGAVLTPAAIQTTLAAAFLAGVAVAAGSLIIRGRSPVPGTRSSGGTSQ